MIPKTCILIVDDDQNVRDSYQYLLEDAGYVVHTASSIPSALDVLQNNTVHIALLDMKMTGETDGLVLNQKIRDQWPDIQTIIITAYTAYNHAVQALKTGASDYLSKAAPTTEILQAIRTAESRLSDRMRSAKTRKPLVLLCGHGFMREALMHFCSLYPEFELTRHYRHANEYLVARASVMPSFLLVCASCNSPDAPDALPLLHRLKAMNPESHVLFVHHEFDAEQRARLLQRGASGFIAEDWDADLLYQAMTRMEAGELWAGRSELSMALRMASRTAPSGPIGPTGELMTLLSPRERDILRLLSLDFSNKDIAHRLGISERTVKTHLYNIYQKLDVHSRSEAVQRACQLNLLP